MNIARYTRKILLGALLLLPGQVAVYAADYIYVSDSLRVGVRNEPVNSAPPVGVVLTGMKLEVLDEQEGYIKIKSTNGVSGWVKDIYVTKTPPAVIELDSLKKSHEKLRADYASQENSLQALQKSSDTIASELEQIKKERTEWEEEKAELSNQDHRGFGWVWWLFFILSLLGGSFALGVLWQKEQVSRRLGGLRI